MSTIGLPVGQVLGGTLLGCGSVLGGLLQLIVLCTLAVRWHAFMSMPFYKLVAALAVSDLLFLSVVLGLNVTEALTIKPVFEEAPTGYRRWVAWLDTWTFFMVFFFTMHITLNRVLVFTAPTAADRLYGTQRRMNWVCVITVTVALLESHAFTLLGCPKTYNKDPFYWYYACDNRTRGPVESAANWLNNKFGQSVTVWPWVGVAAYAAVFLKLRCQNKSSTVGQQNSARNKAERSLLFQGFIVNAFLASVGTSFWLAPYIVAVAGAGTTFIIGGIMTLNSSINPIVYLVFNKLFKQELGRMLGCVGAAAVGPTTGRSRAKTHESQHEGNNDPRRRY